MSAREYNGVRGLARAPWDEPDDEAELLAAEAAEAQRRIDDGECDAEVSL